MVAGDRAEAEQRVQHRNAGPFHERSQLFRGVAEDHAVAADHNRLLGGVDDLDGATDRLGVGGAGRVVLFVANETFGGRAHPCQLFRNLGDGTFVDVAPEAGVAITGIVKGVTWGDYDNDGRPDLYVSRTNAPNLLLRNEGRGADGAWSFSDRTAEAGVAEPWDAFPTWFWDYDNDGWLDIFVAGYRTNFGDIAAEYLNLPHDSELPRLYRNRGDGTFDEVSEAVGLDRIQFSMGSNYGDLDNDGWLDFYVGTGDAYFQALMPNRMFRSDRGEHFQDVTTPGGCGLIEKGHGIAFGDSDHDGDQDVFVAMGGAYEGDPARKVLVENPGPGNRGLSLGREGVERTRAASGRRAASASDGRKCWTACATRAMRRSPDTAAS